MKLVKPKRSLFKQFYEACKESHDNNVTEWMPFRLENYSLWQDQILKIYEKCETGKDLPADMPRTYTYWCVDKGRFIGEAQLRPYLSPEEALEWGHIAYAIRYSKWGRGLGTRVLREVLIKARAFGLVDVYILCAASNVGSIRVAEKNGAVLVSVRDEDGRQINVYRIALDDKGQIPE